MKVCSNKVETQNLAYPEELCAIWRCGCMLMKVCANKVETQNITSHKEVMRDMAVRMCVGESML